MTRCHRKAPKIHIVAQYFVAACLEFFEVSRLKMLFEIIR